jgi:hypothetical protein
MFEDSTAWTTFDGLIPFRARQTAGTADPCPRRRQLAGELMVYGVTYVDYLKSLLAGLDPKVDFSKSSAIGA